MKLLATIRPDVPEHKPAVVLSFSADEFRRLDVYGMGELVRDMFGEDSAREWKRADDFVKGGPGLDALETGAHRETWQQEQEQRNAPGRDS